MDEKLARRNRENIEAMKKTAQRKAFPPRPVRGPIVRMLSYEQIRACKFLIMAPEHYREDGSCKCDDPEHRKMMIAEWGYTEDDFREQG